MNSEPYFRPEHRVKTKRSIIGASPKPAAGASDSLFEKKQPATVRTSSIVFKPRHSEEEANRAAGVMPPAPDCIPPRLDLSSREHSPSRSSEASDSDPSSSSQDGDSYYLDDSGLPIIEWIGKPYVRNGNKFFKSVARGGLVISVNDPVIVKVQGPDNVIQPGYGVIRGLFEQKSSDGNGVKKARIQWLYMYAELGKIVRERFLKKFGSSCRTDLDVFLSDHIDVIELDSVLHKAFVLSEPQSEISTAVEMKRSVEKILANSKELLGSSFSSNAFQCLLSVRLNTLLEAVYPPLEYIPYVYRSGIDDKVDALSIGDRVRLCRFQYNTAVGRVELLGKDQPFNRMNEHQIAENMAAGLQLVIKCLRKQHFHEDSGKQSIESVLKEQASPLSVLGSIFDLKPHPATPKRSSSFEQAFTLETETLTSKGRKRLFQATIQGSLKERKSKRENSSIIDDEGDDSDDRKTKKRVTAEGPSSVTGRSRVGAAFQASLPDFVESCTDCKGRGDVLHLDGPNSSSFMDEVEKFLDLIATPAKDLMYSRDSGLELLSNPGKEEVKKWISSVESQLFDGKQILPFFTHQGRQIYCGDSLALITPDSERLQYFVRVTRIWKDCSDGSVHFDAQWYYYQSQLPLVLRRRCKELFGPFLPKEVLLSDQVDTYVPSHIAGPCIVLPSGVYKSQAYSLRDAHTGRKVPIYQCRLKYLSRQVTVAPYEP